MANKVINILKSEKAEEIKKLMATKENDFDFNVIVPMPKELQNTSCPVHIVSEEDYEKEVKKVEEYNKEKLAQDKTAYLMKLPVTEKMNREIISRYGFSNWYDWAVVNWGTKWNANDVYSDEVLTDYIEFTTAWSTPEPIIKELSLRFLDTLITVEYADEDIGNNCGIYSYYNGKKVGDEEGGEEFACNLWGYDYDEYLAEKEQNQ